MHSCVYRGMHYVTLFEIVLLYSCRLKSCHEDVRGLMSCSGAVRQAAVTRS